MKVGDLGQLEKPKNVNIDTFELNKDETLTQHYLSKNKNKDINKDIAEGKFQDTDEEKHKTINEKLSIFENEYEKHI